jgi:ribosomal-protein-serine acetyltransferase
MRKFDRKIQVNDDLVLRVFEPNEASTLFALVDANREYLAEWLNWVDLIETVRDEAEFIASNERKFQEGTELGYGIYWRGTVVGAMGVFEFYEPQSSACIGYWIAKDFQGKGIVITCCRALISYCFQTLGLDRIQIEHATGNVKSQAVIQGLGLKYERHIQKDEILRGKVLDSNVYRVLKREWPREKS